MLSGIFHFIQNFTQKIHRKLVNHFFQEKWDSMTRKWKDNKSLVQSVRLFLIDEVCAFSVLELDRYPSYKEYLYNSRRPNLASLDALNSVLL